MEKATDQNQVEETPRTRTTQEAEAVDAVKLAVKLVGRAAGLRSLEELYFFLTNDMRTLVEFDRSFLVVHFGGASRFAATSNQPAVDKKSAFLDEWNVLAPALAGWDKVIFLSKRTLEDAANPTELSPVPAEALKRYFSFAGCKYFFALPLVIRGVPIAHLVFEFIEASRPEKAVLENLITMAPSIATALLDQWLAANKPEVWAAVVPGTSTEKATFTEVWKRAAIPVAIALAVSMVLFLLPVDFTVGGEAEVVPRETYMAYTKMDGRVEEIFVESGDKVEKGRMIARLDPTDIKHEIVKTESEAAILTEEIALLSGEVSQDPSKWARKRIAELKRRAASEKLAYLKWKEGFLTITSPVDGPIATKEIESLKGKTFKTGEAFCEIAAQNEIWVEVRVSEERVGYVRPGQSLTFYLNANPSKAYALRVERVAASADVNPRLGNVFRVRAPFQDAPDFVRLGMKGVGRIRTESASIWFIVSQRLRTRWNQFVLTF